MKHFLLFLISSCISILSISQPVITSFSPLSGPVGSTVTITGNGFSTTPSDNIVFFGAVKANVLTATSTSLSVTIPSGATYQPITVTVNNMTTYSKQSFILSFNPGGILAPGGFESVGTIDTVEGIETSDLKHMDIDGDGKIDVAIVDRLNNTLSIYRNTSTGGNSSFDSKIDFATGEQPTGLTIADIDGDGKPEVITTNSKSNSISVFRNTCLPGTISFNSKIDFITGTQPTSVSCADFENDGKPDLAVACISLPGSVTVLKNTSVGSTISFASKIEYNLAGPLNSIVTSDFNGDGKTDIAGADFAANQIIVLANASSGGTISFNPQLSLPTGTFPDFLRVGDLDKDGKPDLAVSNQLSNYVYVYRNTSASGNFSFGSAINLFTQSPDNLGIADIDGDSKPDLVVLNTFQGMSIFKNQSVSGSISFAPKVDFYGSVSENLGIADIDGDNKPDITAGLAMYRALIVKNKVGSPYISSFTPALAGTGTVVTINGYNFTGTSSVSFGGIPASSFTVNSSTKITAVVGAGASGNVSITTPTGTYVIEGFVYAPAPTMSSFTPTTGGLATIVTIAGTGFLAPASVSFGGISASSVTVVSPTTITAVVASGSTGDVIVTTPGGSARLTGFNYMPPPLVSSFTPATGNTGTIINITGTNFTNVVAVSFGGTNAVSFTVNSPTSITATVPGGSSGAVGVSTTYGSANLPGFVYVPQIPPTIISFTPDTGNVGTIVTINGSNFNPVPANNIVSFGTMRATVLTATSTVITCSVPPGTTYGPVSVMNTSTNLTAFSSNSFIQTFTASGPIIFKFHEDISAADTVTSTANSAINLSLADFDIDGKQDMAVVLREYLTILQNTTTAGIFSFAKTNFDIAFDGYDLITADLDGDGKPEIATVNETFNKISIFHNTSSVGSIRFSHQIEYPTWPVPRSIAVGDLNNDGKPDLVTANMLGGGGSISIFRNTSMNGVISFANKIDIITGQAGTGVYLGDIDGDGKVDIAISADNNNNVTVLRNTSAGETLSFAPIVSFPGGLTPFDICGGDVDGDGKPDLVTSSDGYTITILRNTSVPGTISFANKIEIRNHFVVTNQPKRITMGDVNGDGKADIAVAHHIGYIVIYKNNSTPGTIAITPLRSFITADRTTGVAIGDLDNDGKPDLAGSTNSDAKVSLLKNTQHIPIEVSTCERGDITLQAANTGTPYGWEVYDGFGFINIYDSSRSGSGSYDGTLTATLQYNNVPASANGTYYMCFSNYFIEASPIYMIRTQPGILPVINTIANVLTVSNPDPIALYTWQKEVSINTWNDIVPLVTGTSYTALSSGNYRVKMTKPDCKTNSNSRQVLFTAINPVPGNNYGLRVYPNPVIDMLFLDSLNLIDKWETIEINSINGITAIPVISIKNKTQLSLPVQMLKAGTYVGILKRKNGLPVYIKFVKL